ncbi:response regulator transcription factor [Sphingosinithalassobacter portus]|uniref:response regulator transcription factor n=1 Tax=Stakelama portus TaxID=2676234 RepID=UPI001379ABF2|nr:response regulator [Sphingosinithalassobacter portus]
MSHRILVVDDEEPVRKSLTMLLSAYGYEVATAADGEEALETFARFRPALVLSDMVMIRGQGIEVILALRERNVDLPIVAMSGGARMQGDDALVVARRAGATASIEKPFEPDDLLTLLRQLLD